MVNKIQLVGNVGQEVKMHTFDSGKKVASFTLATSETFKDKQGEKQTSTEWHNIKAFGGLAEIIEQYVKKGQLLYLNGTVKYKSYEKEGKKSYFTEIHCFNMKMLGGKSEQKQEITETIIDNKSDGLDTLPF